MLGALLEKDITTPEYYPMTVNALVNACNQKTNRDPVVNYDDETIERALESLRDKHLSTRISGAGHRVEKFGHRISDTLNLGRRELAVMCVLMLRGPQTPGELRGRTERMHNFVDPEEVESVLQNLMELAPDPLVMRMPRQAGTKEARYAHLLSGEVSTADEPAPAPRAERTSGLDAEVSSLRAEIQDLREQFAQFRKQFE